MITKAIRNAFKFAKDRSWEKTYWAFDIHGTMIEPNYKPGEIPKLFYPHAKEALQRISRRDDIVLILFTCSHPDELIEYDMFFREHDIHFNYLNKNPEVQSGAYGCYDAKFYFNVLFEDKAGFDPLEDWEKVHELLNEYEKK
jgi:hypothetical protein